MRSITICPLCFYYILKMISMFFKSNKTSNGMMFDEFNISDIFWVSSESKYVHIILYFNRPLQKAIVIFGEKNTRRKPKILNTNKINNGTFIHRELSDNCSIVNYLIVLSSLAPFVARCSRIDANVVWYCATCFL